MSVLVAVLVVFSAGLSAGIWLGAWITERAEDAVDREFPPLASRYAETFPSTTAPDLPRESLPPIPPALLADKRTDVPWFTVDDNGQAVRMVVHQRLSPRGEPVPLDDLTGEALYRAVPVDQDGGEG